MKKYTIELSAYGSYEGIECKDYPTPEEKENVIQCFFEDLMQGYIDIDVNCYEEEDE